MSLAALVRRVAGFLARPHSDAKSFEQEVERAGFTGRSDAGRATLPTHKVVGSVGRAHNLRSDFFYRRGRALTWLAIVARWTGAGEAAALALHEQSRAVARRAGDRREEAIALYNLGAHSQAGDLAGAQARLAAALTIMRKLDDRCWTATILHDLGNVAFRRGDLAGARALQEQAVAVHRATGEEWMLSMTLEWLSHTVEAQGDPEGARALLEESAAIRRQTGTGRFTAAALRALAEVARLQGDPAAAHTALEEARAVEAAGAAAPALDRTAARAGHGAAGDSGASRPAAVTPRRPGRSGLPGGLTAREAEVLRHVAAGETDRQIGAALIVTEDTVGRHLTHIFHKLDVASRAGASAFAVRHGLA